MNDKPPYSNPEEIERKRALEFLALSPTEKYHALMKLIKISYQIRQSNQALIHPAK